MPTLLIVDDSRLSRMMIKTRVNTLRPDWTVIEAGTGLDGLDLVSQHQPDFITMDVNMPGISGFEAVERVRAAGSQAKVVILTANIQESSRERAQALGVHFLHKPVTDTCVQQALDYFEGQAAS